MKTFNYISKRLSLFLLTGVVMTALVSCGTYKSAGYDDGDGIYANSQRSGYDNASSANSFVYKNYFESKQEDVVLTDVDNYSSDNYDPNNPNNNENYGAWGSNSDNVTVNVYQDSWGMGGWGNPYWGFNSFYGPGWGWGSGWGWGW